jgi:hypothetical protein
MNGVSNPVALARKLALEPYKGSGRSTLEDRLRSKMNGSDDKAVQKFMNDNYYFRTQGLPLRERAQEIVAAVNWKQSNGRHEGHVIRLFADAPAEQQAELLKTGSSPLRVRNRIAA